MKRLCGKVIQVRVTTETDENDETHLQYVTNTDNWERINSDLEIFQLRFEGHWFKPDVWVVEKFAGADTAAIGGGTVRYEGVAEFEDQFEALQYMANL